MKTVHIALIVFVSAVSATDKKCLYPSSVWCSSEQITRACQVEEQCQNYLTSSVTADKVNLALYFESLCPDCQRFWKTELWKAYNAVGNIMNITLVPYGNAHEQKDALKDEWTFKCQHGKEECVGNLIETCAIAIMKNFTEYFSFIYCMEVSTSNYGDPEKAAEKCAKQLNVQSLQSIMSCSQGTMGNRLEHQMALLTEALNPPHRYVPWVTLNGVHNEEIEKKAENDLIGLVCDTYQGPKPAACNKHHRTSKCYKEQKPEVLKWLPLVGSQ